MKLWPFSSATGTDQSTTAPWMPLRVVARAMCCAVGHTAPAASAAINARINHFRETGFVARGGAPITGGALYEVGAWGAERLGLMLRTVIAEAMAGQPGIDTRAVAILVLGAEPGRPGMSGNCLAEALAAILEEMRGEGRQFHASGALCVDGKGGVGKALAPASLSMAQRDGPAYVLLAAVDSLLDAGAIEHYLDQERLATKSNADGFIPAEGAAAVLLSRAEAAAPALWIDALASTEEAWRFGADTPVRARALTDAMRNAAQAAGCEIAALDFHASGMTGEGWYAKEVSMALARCMERKKAQFPHLMVARSVGETGAASALLTLAWLAALMGHPTHSPGRAGLLHFAGDDGRRTAMVVRYRAAPPAS